LQSGVSKHCICKEFSKIMLYLQLRNFYLKRIKYYIYLLADMGKSLVTQNPIVKRALMQIDLSLNDLIILDNENYQIVLDLLKRMEHTNVRHISGTAITQGVELGWVRKTNPFEPWSRVDYIEYVYYDKKFKSGRITVKYSVPRMDYLRIHNANNEISPFGIPIDTTHFRFLEDNDGKQGIMCFTLYDNRSDKYLDGDYWFRFFGLKPTKYKIDKR
jgi:hypothetical protein